MKKLKLQVQMSLDGFVAGPNGEMDWMTWNWSEDIKNYVSELTESVDTILLGRKMAGGFIAHWTNTMNNPDEPEQHPFARKMVKYSKVVFSQTLQSSEWDNTELAIGELNEDVKAIKNRSGKDIIVYGGASFNASLIKAGLIDEFHLFVNPTVIGKGLSIFKEIEEKQNLQLKKAIPFDCGIVLMHYEPKKG
ncbi:dihydrofolate reductase family protein [Rapidithrix thailandica]|uniref:Dihydrofolate reductase family protein n=1 Tax=Rapidithrix thailandica TaxID=413964 RepID=A0AAW9SF91_9BACT